MSIDLLDYMRGDVGPDGVNGKPVGVKHTGAHDGIFQVQRDGNTRRWFQVKGAWDNPPPKSDWEELWFDDTYVYRAVDTSRKPSEGGPYTLTDAGATRGSKWIKRRMNVGDMFFRNPTIYPFDMNTGVRAKAEGQAPTWIKLAAVHPQWQGIPDVIELHWLLNENDTIPKERTFYGKGLGQVGFIGSGMETTPNGVFPDFPPATGIPVLERKPAPWLPAMPAASSDSTPLTDFRIVNPARFPHTVYSNFGWRDSPGKPGERDFHTGADLTPSGPGPYPVNAAAAGTVTYAGTDDTGYGTRVDIDHGSGYSTRYAHMDPLAVQAGQQVTTDTWLGYADKQGWATGIHLHFEVRKDGVAVDPLPFLNTAPTPPVTEPPVSPTPTPAVPRVEVHFANAEEKARYVRLHRAIADAIEAAPGMDITLDVVTA